MIFDNLFGIIFVDSDILQSVHSQQRKQKSMITEETLKLIREIGKKRVFRNSRSSVEWLTIRRKEKKREIRNYRQSVESLTVKRKEKTNSENKIKKKREIRNSRQSVESLTVKRKEKKNSENKIKKKREIRNSRQSGATNWLGNYISRVTWIGR